MAHSSDQFRLAVVIPVWNDAEGLARLLPQVLALPEVVQVIVVDDASDPPCNADNIALGDWAGDARLIWARSEDQRGAGHARNLGLGMVEADHVLYFDSDDIILPEFIDLIADLSQADTPDFDFCLFRHVDSRRRAQGIEAPLASDQFHWDMIGLPNDPRLITRDEAARLCRVSAYPWNKIYKTEFLRLHQIKCTEIMVHNDVELHWTSFMRASNIIASTRVCCEHFVSPGGSRLTNRSGKDRLQVFEALNAVQEALVSAPETSIVFIDAALEFYLNLFQWIYDFLDEELRKAFMSKAQDFLFANMSVPLVTLAATRDPMLARRLNTLLTRPLP
ncbi:glycosyltransferase family 2 protein [Donghicola mangrovi]|uniref:Glycosyltransferase family 2 protein n=1 Tax=Donghicola mangrovi TaxID=2729614 RepID=A0A850Q9A9_9RHOB|nr:glycosyltransferase family A protein [Donghicola mangrovi]NVO25736.1 glycosyltransferase family 2 protein [Donghicola mangrovi]